MIGLALDVADPAGDVVRCVGCGCSELDACEGGCGWIDPLPQLVPVIGELAVVPLCTACVVMAALEYAFATTPHRFTQVQIDAFGGATG